MKKNTLNSIFKLHVRTFWEKQKKCIMSDLIFKKMRKERFQFELFLKLPNYFSRPSQRPTSTKFKLLEIYIQSRKKN